MTSLGDHWYPKGTLPEPFLPVEIDRVRGAFPASTSDLLPSADRIPDEFTQFRPNNKWSKLFGDRFYSGLESIEFFPKKGIDPEAAWRHISAIMGSWEPKHEYKEAACIFLMDLWFDDIKWTVKTRT